MRLKLPRISDEATGQITVVVLMVVYLSVLFFCGGCSTTETRFVPGDAPRIPSPPPPAPHKSTLPTMRAPTYAELKVELAVLWGDYLRLWGDFWKLKQRVDDSNAVTEDE